MAYLDRINVGFADALIKQQLRLLRFSDAQYDFGAGIFFAGYLLFQIPSSLIFERVGAKRWIAILLICWGVVSSSMALVRSPSSFYVLRFLLGVLMPVFSLRSSFISSTGFQQARRRGPLPGL